MGAAVSHTDTAVPMVQHRWHAPRGALAQRGSGSMGNAPYPSGSPRLTAAPSLRAPSCGTAHPRRKIGVTHCGLVPAPAKRGLDLSLFLLPSLFGCPHFSSGSGHAGMLCFNARRWLCGSGSGVKTKAGACLKSSLSVPVTVFPAAVLTPVTRDAVLHM